jgi:hypothetical protein
MTKGNKSTAKSKSNPTTTKTNKKDMSWKYIEPPEDIKKEVKIWDDKEWWWCDNHKAYVPHKPEDCEGKGVKPSAASNIKTTSKGPAKNTRQLRFSKALQAVNNDKMTVARNHQMRSEVLSSPYSTRQGDGGKNG